MNKNKILWIKRLIADGKHNAFTGMVHWQGYYYLVFRTSSAHAGGSGQIRMLRSSDLTAWEDLPTPLKSERNHYEAHFLPWNDKLFIFGGSYDAGKNGLQNSCRDVVSYTANGVDWAEEKMSNPPRFRRWHPLLYNGVIYSAAYRFIRDGCNELGVIAGSNFQVRLIKSLDGFNWEDVSTISRNEAGNETELYFEKDGTLHAFVRREFNSVTLVEYIAEPPYAKWQGPVDLGEIIQGHTVQKINNRLFLAGRRKKSSSLSGTIFEDRSTITVHIWCYNEKERVWQSYLTLPGAADCAYPALVPLTDKSMLVSWYSQHEYIKNNNFQDMSGAADIFLAEISTEV